MFTIELTRGLSWSEPIETIDRRKCDTISIEFVAAGSSALAANDPEECADVGRNPLSGRKSW